MRILIGMVVLALALPASAALVNGDFETGDLSGWTTDGNVRLNPDSYVPDPRPSVAVPTVLDQAAPVADGQSRAGDGHCQSRNSLGWQEAYCPVNPVKDCYLVGWLAGGASGGLDYWVRAGTAPGDATYGELKLSGVLNWTLVQIPIGPCLGQSVTVSFGSTGDGTWGAAGYHVDGLDLVCIPEPATGLLLLGLAGLPLIRRR